MEEMLDKPSDDDNIPRIMDEIRKKNIKILKGHGKPTKFHTFKTNLTGPNMTIHGHCVTIRVDEVDTLYTGQESPLSSNPSKCE